MPSERKQINIRLSDDGCGLLDALTAATGLSQSDVIHQGLRLLAKRELAPGSSGSWGTTGGSRGGKRRKGTEKGGDGPQAKSA